MLHDLDLSLKKLLEAELPQHFSATAGIRIEITFVTPADGVFSRLPALNLFLYDIRENQELRNNSWSVTRQDDGTATREAPPVRVDCSYLITMWPSDPKDFTTEHRLLGEVLQVLLRHAQLPSTVLQGALVNSQPPPRRTSTLGQVKLQSLGEFWQAMGNKPKATLNYTLTVAVPVHTEIQRLPLVRSMGAGNG